MSGTFKYIPKTSFHLTFQYVFFIQNAKKKFKRHSSKVSQIKCVVKLKKDMNTSGGLTWGQNGRFSPPVFFPLPLFENLTSVKIVLMGFTHYLLWG